LECTRTSECHHGAAANQSGWEVAHRKPSLGLAVLEAPEKRSVTSATPATTTAETIG
jgi:hypothetical protein